VCGLAESGGDLLWFFLVLDGLIGDPQAILKSNPLRHLGQELEAPSLRQRFSAVSANWKIRPSKVFLEMQFLVRVVRCRMVTKLDSIGLVVRIWTPCSAGKS
jgi:hypothetical protein